MEELHRSTMLWVDQHCSLIEIRPGKYIYIGKSLTKKIKLISCILIRFLAVSDKLRYLSTTTDILSDPPSTLQEEVLKAISSNNNNNNNSNS